MSTEANKAVVRRWIELQNQGNLDALEEVLAPEHAASYRKGNEPIRIAFPGYQQVVEDMIAEGDKVVTRVTIRAMHRGEFFGIAPTGREVEYGVIAIDRLQDGKVVESWEEADNLGLLEQIGAVAPLGQ